MSSETNKKIVPELRFPEFWDVGEWEESPLGRCIIAIGNVDGLRSRLKNAGLLRRR